MEKNKNILIVRVDRVGDVVLTIPLISVIKENIPNSNIYFLANSYTRDLVEGNSDVKGTIILLQSLRNNYLLLKEYKFDTVILASPTFKLALLFFLLKVKNRVGTGYRWYSFLFNKKQYEHRRFGNKHELEYNVNLIKALGIIPEINFQCKLPVNQEDITRVNSLLSEKGMNEGENIIIIHPGSGGSAMDLPKEQMEELVKKIDSLENYRICFTGSKHESDLVNEINSSINNRGISFVGEISLRELTYLIKKSKLFIANSTGPIHIAAAVGTFVIGFYPPVSAMSADRWGPYTDKKFIFIPMKRYVQSLEQGKLCIRCEKNKCLHYDCMNSISIDDVFLKVNEILHNSDSI
jgi:heptosyltransferase III